MNIKVIVSAALGGLLGPRSHAAERALINPAIGENRVVVYRGSLPPEKADKDLVTLRLGGASDAGGQFVCTWDEQSDDDGNTLQRAAEARLSAAYSHELSGWCTGMQGGGEFCPGKSVTVDFLRAEPVGKAELRSDGSVQREYETPGMEVRESCQCDRNVTSVNKEDFDFESLCVPGRREQLDDGSVITILRTYPAKDRYEVAEETEDGEKKKYTVTYRELAGLGVRCSGNGMPRRFFEISDVALDKGATGVTVESVACCPTSELGPPDEALTKLLAPLTGTCLHYASGEQVWEYCHPFNLRMMLGLTPDTARAVDLLSSVDDVKYNPERREVLVEGVGDALSAIQMDLLVKLPGHRQPLKAAGGIFNPPWFFNLTAAPVAVPQGSSDGCKAFEAPAAARIAERRGIPWIAVARRGNCFFQNKTVNAQASGASGLIVINSKSSAMVRWMDGMPDAEMPLIPTALVGYEGESLMSMNDAAASDFSVSDPQQIILTKPGPPDDKIRTRIAFVCDETFRSADVKATSTCRPGDGVTLNRPAEAPRPAIVKEVMGGGMLKVDTIEDDGVTQRRGRIIHSGYAYKSPGRSCVAVGGNAIIDAKVGEQGVADVRIHSELLCSHPAMLKPWHKEYAWKCYAHGPTVTPPLEAPKSEPEVD
ncbi:hypothetical protein FOL46_001814 [Perkinsus olseni]|uniref:PA domain-containing protein n=1 Tax=Perkinsus olseni TaxID=32597 RepID=A0A7J6MBN2_PEROL|nr:hypothetical protein FOL46_001814 [Perkinsus olseni]